VTKEDLHGGTGKVPRRRSCSCYKAGRVPDLRYTGSFASDIVSTKSRRQTLAKYFLMGSQVAPILQANSATQFSSTPRGLIPSVWVQKDGHREAFIFFIAFLTTKPN
jgi:hypothetical protein